MPVDTHHPQQPITRLLAWSVPLGLMSVVFLHAGLSQPAPTHLGLVEIMIGAALVVLVGVYYPGRVVTGTALYAPSDRGSYDRWASWLCLLAFSILLWGGSIRAVLAGWSLGDISRDLIPLLFFFLPLWLSPRRARVLNPGLLAIALCVGGGLMAWRYLIGTELPSHDWGHFIYGQSLAYLANSPLIAFSASFGLLLPLFFWLNAPGFQGASRHGSYRPLMPRHKLARYLLCLVLLGAAGLALLTMATAGQRAPLGLVTMTIVAAVLWLGVGFGMRHRLARTTQYRLALFLVLLTVLGLVLALFNLLPSDMWHALAEKSRLVGDNARLAEWSAIWQLVGDEVLTLIFGLGWGAHYASPAVGDYYVGYAHGLMPYLLLKTGLFGWLAAVLYGVALVLWARAAYRAQPWLSGLMIACLLPPLMTGALFYTSYKFLGFGLLLLLLRVMAVPPSTVTANHPSPTA